MGKNPRRTRSTRRKPVERSFLTPEGLAEEISAETNKTRRQREGVPISILYHLEQAKALPIPEEIEEGSLMHRAYTGYLDKRTVVSEDVAKKIKAAGVSAAAEQLVVEELIPSVQDAPTEALDMVAEGVRLARIALEDTYQA
jgi:hypothetical protein